MLLDRFTTCLAHSSDSRWTRGAPGEGTFLTVSFSGASRLRSFLACAWPQSGQPGAKQRYDCIRSLYLACISQLSSFVSCAVLECCSRQMLGRVRSGSWLFNCFLPHCNLFSSICGVTHNLFYMSGNYLLSSSTPLLTSGCLVELLVRISRPSLKLLDVSESWTSGDVIGKGARVRGTVESVGTFDLIVVVLL